MTPREVVRRICIWTIASASFGITFWMALRGSPIALVQNTGLTVVGAILLTSRPGNRIGLLALLSPLLILPDQALEVTGLAASVPAGVEAALAALGSVSTLALPLAVILFPTGRIQTRGGRWIVVTIAVTAAVTLIAAIIDPMPLFTTGRANPFGIPALAPLFGPPEFRLTDGLWLVAVALIAAALAEIIVRWRRSSGAEQLQYRWFAFGVSIVLVAVTISIAAMFQTWALVLYAVSLNAIPITIGIAVTRHGLYEINRVVSRTVAYGIVTVMAIGVYALVVTSVTWLIPDAPSIAVAAATLVAAALCLPVLRGVQRALDRRFDRERYDAQRVVDEFGERLRTEIDPAQTATDLIAAVERTLRPASVGLWTREGER